MSEEPAPEVSIPATIGRIEIDDLSRRAAEIDAANKAEALARKVYGELESILPVYPGSPSAGELAQIRKWVFAENKEPETALMLVWGYDLYNAPLGLFPLIRPEMELAKLPSIAARLDRLDEGYRPPTATAAPPPRSTGKLEEDLLNQVYRQNRIKP